MKCCRGEVVGSSEEAAGKGDEGRRSLTASEGRERHWHRPSTSAAPEGREPRLGRRTGRRHRHIQSRMSKYTRPRAQVTRPRIRIRRFPLSRSRTETGHRSSREKSAGFSHSAPISPRSLQVLERTQVQGATTTSRCSPNSVPLGIRLSEFCQFSQVSRLSRSNVSSPQLSIT